MIHQALQRQDVKFPKHWNEDFVIEAITNLHEEELLEAFSVKTKATLTKMLKPCFPNKPDRVSFRSYILGVLEKDKQSQDNMINRLKNKKLEQE